jgi:site-specific recombinase XerD
MTFRMVHRTDLPASQSPFRIVDDSGRELEWANKFLDVHCLQGLAKLTLRFYALMILHFVRWAQRAPPSQPGVDVLDFRAGQFTESTLVDYVRAQVDQHPPPSPENINSRSSMLRRLFRFYFEQDMPHAPYLIQRRWYRPPEGWRGRRPFPSADLKVKVAQRVIVPLDRDQVHRFWHSFDTARDMAIVALMVLDGLRSGEVLGLTLEDLLFSEAQVHVRGKGRRVRRVPGPEGAPPGNDPSVAVLFENGTSADQPERGICFAQRKGPRQSHDAGGLALVVSPSPQGSRCEQGQPAPISTYVRFGHGSRRRQPARAAASDGPRAY